MRLEGLEWNDIEFKEAAGGIPQKIWRSVSVFSNTRGGWIEMTIPEKPQSRLQKYRLTAKARQWLADQSSTKQ